MRLMRLPSRNPDGTSRDPSSADVAALMTQMRRLEDALAERQKSERQRYCSVAEAAEILGLSPKTVRLMLNDDRLIGFKRGKRRQSRWIVDINSVQRARNPSNSGE